MVDLKDVARWSAAYGADARNRVMENVVSNNALSTLCAVRAECQKYDPVYNVSVTPKLRVTNQRSSGRCWLFAALNVMRRPVCAKYNLANFEFSQSHLFFWDKLERMNFNLERIADTMNEADDSRIVQHILDDPTCDGGQWDMVVNLIEKYGVVPQSVFKETFHSGNSAGLNAVLKKLFRAAAAGIRDGDKDARDRCMADTYAILCQFLGEPPSSFDWEYTDKDDKYHCVKNLSPKSFYVKCVDFNTKDYVGIVDDARNAYENVYTVEGLGNVVGGEREKISYLNLPIDRLKELTLDALKANEGVWFGCDVGQYFSRVNCSMDAAQFDYMKLLGKGFDLDKEQRMRFRDSLMTHAMVFTGANTSDTRGIRSWEVENSWAVAEPMAGYYFMSDAWFTEFVYEVVIKKDRLSAAEQSMLDKPSNGDFPPWDPMGSLA